MDPFCILDNPQQYVIALGAREVQQFADLGGRTVLDPTNRGIGRDPRALAAISRRTGLNVLMHSAYYLEASHPPPLNPSTSNDIAPPMDLAPQPSVHATAITAGFI